MVWAMKFNGFSQKDFDTFLIDGLDERMKAIQTRIQPKFQEIGSYLTDYLSVQLGNEVFLHIAKHARRTVNPPQDTWLAIADKIGRASCRERVWRSVVAGELSRKKGAVGGRTKETDNA